MATTHVHARLEYDLPVALEVSLFVAPADAPISYGVKYTTAVVAAVRASENTAHAQAPQVWPDLAWL